MERLLICGLCGELWRSPVTLVCGHSYCSPCLAAGGRCPHHPGPKWKPSPSHIININVTLNEIVEAIRSSSTGAVTLTGGKAIASSSASDTTSNTNSNNNGSGVSTPSRRATATTTNDMGSPRQTNGEASTPLSVRGNGHMRKPSANVRAFPADDDTKSNTSVTSANGNGNGMTMDHKPIMDAHAIAALKREKNKLQLEQQRRQRQQSKKEEKEQARLDEFAALEAEVAALRQGAQANNDADEARKRKRIVRLLRSTRRNKAISRDGTIVDSNGSPVVGPSSSSSTPSIPDNGTHDASLPNASAASNKPKRSGGRARVAGHGLARGRVAATAANIGITPPTPKSDAAVNVATVIHTSSLPTTIPITNGTGNGSNGSVVSSPPRPTMAQPSQPSSQSRPTTRGGTSHGSRARNRTPPPDPPTDKMMTTTAPLSALLNGGNRSRPPTNSQIPQPTASPPRSSHSRSAPIPALLALPANGANNMNNNNITAIHASTIPADDGYTTPQDMSPGRPVTGSRAAQVRAMAKGASHSQLPSPRTAAQTLTGKRSALQTSPGAAGGATTGIPIHRGRSKTPRRDGDMGSDESTSRSPAPPTDGAPSHRINRRASMGRLPSRGGGGGDRQHTPDASHMNGNGHGNGSDHDIGAVTAPLSTVLAANRTRARTSAGRWRTRDREEKRQRAVAAKNQEESRQLFRDKFEREMQREEERLQSPDRGTGGTTTATNNSNGNNGNNGSEVPPTARQLPPAVRSSMEHAPNSLAALASALGAMPSSTPTTASPQQPSSSSQPKPEQSSAPVAVPSSSIPSPRRQSSLDKRNTPSSSVAPVPAAAVSVSSLPSSSSNASATTATVEPTSPFFASPRAAAVPRAFNADHDDFDDDDANAAVIAAVATSHHTNGSISISSNSGNGGNNRRILRTNSSESKTITADDGTTVGREAAVAANIDALIDQRSLRGRVAAAAKGTRGSNSSNVEMYHPGQWRHHTNNEPYCWSCCYSRKKESPGCKRKPAAPVATSSNNGTNSNVSDELGSPSSNGVRRSLSKTRL